MGLPQLVQSRPQFGYLGAAVTVWVFALVNYVAYNTSDALLSGDAMNVLFGVNTDAGLLHRGLIAAVVALYGYHWIHRHQPLAGLAADRDHGPADRRRLPQPALPAHAFAPGTFKPQRS